MKEFLKKLQLSDEAITIYLNSLGYSYLSYNELYSFVSEVNPEIFSNFVKELIDNGLLIQITPKSSEILLYFLALPPFQPILDYFYNINSKLSDIIEQSTELVTNILNNSLKDYKTVVTDFYISFQEIRKDITEDSLIQKQEVEEIVKKYENLKKINEELVVLKSLTKSSSLMQLSNLIKKLITVKASIIDQVKKLKLKKVEEEIINIIEEEFNTKLERFNKEFSSEIVVSIEENFNNTNLSINRTINKVFEFRDEFKTLYLSAISNFEIEVNKFQTLIKNAKDLPKDETTNLINLMSKDLTSFISNSLKQFSGLNKPIEGLMEQFIQKVKSVEDISINQLWFINSRTKIFEEIQNLIENSKEKLYLVVPKIEDYISIDLFKQLSKNLKVKIAASNAATDAIVNIFKEVRNFEYKSIPNNESIILKGDNNHIVIGISLNDSKDKLKNIIGFGSNFQPIVRTLSPIIDAKWEPEKIEIKTTYQPKTVQPAILEKETNLNHIPPKTVEKQISPITEVPKTVPQHINHEAQVSPQKIESIEIKTSKQPSEGDESGILINNAFNTIIEKINLINGIELSKELEKISDMILNTRGFSIALHDIRRVIVHYRTLGKALNQQEKNEILESIQNWKQKLF